jgi:hypothetical protein
MKNFRCPTSLALIMLFTGGIANAGDNFWVGAKVGTLGIGLEGTWRPIDWLDLRIGGNTFDYSDSGSQAGVNYDAELNLRTYYLTGNLRFPLSPFRITVGAYKNENTVEMISVDNPTFDIGGTIYTAADVGTLTSTTSFDGTSPYFGAGFDFSLFNRLGLSLDFGVLWQGDPKVSLGADGLLANDPTFLSDLNAELEQLTEEVDYLKAYPVVSLGVNFNF